MWSYICLLRSIQVFLETRWLERNAESSEHCRHKLFNALLTIDGVKKDFSLFSMIRNTNEKSPRYVVSAYSDNAVSRLISIYSPFSPSDPVSRHGTRVNAPYACVTTHIYLEEETLTPNYVKAVLDAQEGQNASFFAPLHMSKEWTQINERMYYVIKAESHNHPTAISPFPGAATGVSSCFRRFSPY